MKTIVDVNEALNLYSNFFELSIRAAKTLQSGVERSIREHLAYLDAGQPAPLAAVETPKDVWAAQSAAVERARDEFTTTAKRLAEIQQDVATELKSLAAEGTKTFSSEVVGKLFKAA